MDLPLFPQDKANHVIYGAGLGLVGVMAAVCTGTPEYSRVVAFATSASGGALKEAIDWFMNRRSVRAGGPKLHDVDGLDFLATCLGGLLVIARP